MGQIDHHMLPRFGQNLRDARYRHTGCDIEPSRQQDGATTLDNHRSRLGSQARDGPS